MKTTVAFCIGLTVGVGLTKLELPKRSSDSHPQIAARKITTEDLQRGNTAGIVSNLLACREARVRVACSQGSSLGECDRVRRVQGGDGLFNRLKELRENPSEQASLASLALNRCQMADDDPRATTLDEFLSAQKEQR